MCDALGNLPKGFRPCLMFFYSGHETKMLLCVTTSSVLYHKPLCLCDWQEWTLRCWIDVRAMFGGDGHDNSHIELLLPLPNSNRLAVATEHLHQPLSIPSAPWCYLNKRQPPQPSGFPFHLRLMTHQKSCDIWQVWQICWQVDRHQVAGDPVLMCVMVWQSSHWRLGPVVEIACWQMTVIHNNNKW